MLVVLIYHSGFGLLPGGYLGVDVFFVISGFLITRMLASSIADGTFPFRDFYWRRAKRLLPAAYVTFFVVALVSPWLLTALELRDLKHQLIGALVFAGNIPLWQQTGYFAEAAEAKPLLHVWSLAIEEQYYLLLPLALMICPRRYWLPAAILLGAASLALCLWLVPWKPSAAFFLLPTRAWELAIGSIGALMVVGGQMRAVLQRMAFPAVGVLVVLAAVPLGGGHPGGSAILVCLATFVIILAQHGGIERARLTRGLARVGDFSYSLYLVNWPLFAFLNAAAVGEVPASARLGALVASLVLGYLLYKLVETPCRRFEVRAGTGPVAAAIATASLLVAAPVLIPAGAASRQATLDFAHIRRVNHGLGPDCEFTGPYDGRAKCRTSIQPQILVWGDSIAMHLVPGLAKLKAPLAQATMSYCGPLLSVAPIERKAGTAYTREWAQDCIAFNESVAAFLEQTPSIRVVVLSSLLGQYLPASGNRVLINDPGDHQAHDADLELALDGLRRTVEKVRELGRRVVIVAPPPSADFNVGKCLERFVSGKIVLGPSAACFISAAGDHRATEGVLALLAQVGREANVSVVSFDEQLCVGGRCKTLIGDTLVYRDERHLTHAGSELLATAMGWPRLLETAAR